MDKLRVGIFIDELCVPSWGGGYSYYMTLLEAINRYPFPEELEFVNIVFSKKGLRQVKFTKPVISVKNDLFTAFGYNILKLMYRFFVRLKSVHLSDVCLKSMYKVSNQSTINTLKKENIDLIYYLAPNPGTMNYPFITTHWDIGHKSMYSFPEVAADGMYEKREEYYIKTLNKAFLILCESTSGAEELLTYYSINREKVNVLPIFSGAVVDMHVNEESQNRILSSYKVFPDKFFVYPAQFWAHKNHYNLVKAFHLLLKEPGNSSLKLILCGKDAGNRNYIIQLINELNLENSVLLPGFVSMEDLYVLYKNAAAMIMPTFLGPTNMPLIEAAELGCPVLCSALKGHREILGDGALYFNPVNAEDIKNCMQSILNNDFRKKLIKTANDQITNSAFSVEKSVRSLQDILLKMKPIRKAWGVYMHILLTGANTGMWGVW